MSGDNTPYTLDDQKIPLLQNSNNVADVAVLNSRITTTSIVDHVVGEEDGDLFKRVWDESKKLWHIVGPAIISRITSYAMLVVTQSFAGHLGDLELAAISISSNVIVGFDIGLLLGMASALETLCGQAYGAKKYQMLGVYMQRSWIVLTICCILLLPLYLCASPILKALGQPEDVAELTGLLTLWIIPLHFAFAFQFPLQRFLQSQLKTGIIACITVVALLIHVLASWLFVSVLKCGIIGVAATLNIGWGVLVVGLFSYTVGGGCPLSWGGFSMEAFSGLWEFVKLSVASGVMLCLENWYYRILILMTGNLQNAEIALDALSICMSINGWEMMIPLAFFAAAGVRVANELGAGNGKAAKFATKVAVLTSMAIGLFFWLLIMILHDKFAYIFSASPPVVDAVNQLSLLLAFTILLNSVQPVLSGVAVGSGWQSSVAYINLGCYYLLGVPLGFLMGWQFNLGVEGIWAGMIFGGTVVQTVILIIITARCDWDKELMNKPTYCLLFIVTPKTLTSSSFSTPVITAASTPPPTSPPPLRARHHHQHRAITPTARHSPLPQQPHTATTTTARIATTGTPQPPPAHRSTAEAQTAVKSKMAPSKKGGNENNKEGEEMGRANWSKETLIILCDLCMVHMEKSKGKNGGVISQMLNWKKMVPEFYKRTKLSWSKEQLKHKYDWMKVRWTLWKKLKGRETGLGWNHEKGTIEASEEWWTKKIEEDLKFKTFRDEGIEPELEDKLDQLFRSNVAREDSILTPNMDPLLDHVEDEQQRVYIPSQSENENYRSQRFDFEDVGETPNSGFDLKTGGSAWQELWHENSTPSSPSPSPISQEVQDGRDEIRRVKRTLDTSVSEPNKTSRGTTSTTSTKRMGLAAMLCERLDGMMELMISERNERKVEREKRKERRERMERNKNQMNVDDQTPNLSDVLAKLCIMPGLDHTSPLFTYACTVIEDPQKRIILYGLPTDEARVRWLSFLYEEHKRKST